VQTAATLVSGDDCAIELELGPNASLDILETGATIAHHVRDGPPARMRIDILLGAGARLRWLGRPLVLAAGCALHRTTHVDLADGARALLRETVVLGRSGQQPGALTSRMRATLGGRPLLHEQLDTSDLALLRSPVVAGEAEVLDTLLLLGDRGEELPGSTQLAGPGTVWRSLAPRGTDPDGPALAVARAWWR
jgi:urease accessory protein